MKKAISKKAAVEIRNLYNSIDVADIMRKSALEKFRADKISRESFDESAAHWEAYGLNAARELAVKYGIVPVSFRAQLSKEGIEA